LNSKRVNTGFIPFFTHSIYTPYEQTQVCEYVINTLQQTVLAKHRNRMVLKRYYAASQKRLPLDWWVRQWKVRKSAEMWHKVLNDTIQYHREFRMHW